MNTKDIKNAQLNSFDNDTEYGSNQNIFDTGMFAQLENRKGYNDTSVNSTLNPYVNFNDHKPAQSLHNMVSAESIQTFGIKAYYLRRNMDNVDLVLGEDPLSVFEDNFQFAAWLESYNSWNGTGDSMAVFGLVVNDEMSLIVNDALFRHQGDGDTLKEGDLIYIPKANALMEINWVEQENEEYYQLGSIPNRQVTCSKFVYSGEEINVTGNPDDISELTPVSNLEYSWQDSLIAGDEMQDMINEVADIQNEVTIIPNQPTNIIIDDDGYQVDDDVYNPFDENEF